jgi:hypothetical protein
MMDHEERLTQARQVNQMGQMGPIRTAVCCNVDPTHMNSVISCSDIHFQMSLGETVQNVVS